MNVLPAELTRFFCCLAISIVVLASRCFGATNVVFITVDDMNCDSVGAFGCPLPGTTPSIDALAAEGMRFEHAHVTIAICQPTRAVWMTGRYPHRNGALGFDPIDADVPTLVESLHDADYYTAILGKTTHVVPTRAHAWREITKMEDLGFGRDPSKYQERMVQIMRTAAAQQRPFFIMANVHDPHRPLDDSAGSIKRQRTHDFPKPDKIFLPQDVPIPAFLSDLPDIRIELARYYRSVRRADDSVGAILRAIDSTGHKENTLVIFMSDHGMPLPFAKTNCWRHSTRTPWIVRWPKFVESGKHDTRHMVSGIDLASTILEAVGLPELPGTDGQSIIPILRGRQQTGRDWVVTHMNRTAGKKQFPMRSVVGKRFGYIYNAWPNGEIVFKNESQNGLTMKALRKAAANDSTLQRRVDQFLLRTSEEFYDYSSDPDALQNLIDRPEHQTRIDQFRRRLLEHMQSTRDPHLSDYETFLRKWQVTVAATESNASYRGLHVLNSNTAWATGQNGSVLRTVDGGQTWANHRIPDSESLDFRSVVGLSSESAIAISAGTPARIVKTIDGGQTWQVKYDNSDKRVFFDAAAFWDVKNGITFSDPVDGKLLLLTTDNGGETWSVVDRSDIPDALAGEAGFAASNSCLTVLDSDSDGRYAWIGLGGETGQRFARVFRSPDGGKRWSVSTTTIPTGKSSGVFSLSFRDERYGVAVGGDYQQADRGGADVVSVTRDGGETWHPIVGPGPNGFRSAVALANVNGQSAFVACGPNGADISFDGGQSWRPLTIDRSASAFHAIGFAGSRGIGVGADGKVATIVFPAP